jgi:hypothetical protein
MGYPTELFEVTPNQFQPDGGAQPDGPGAEDDDLVVRPRAGSVDRMGRGLDTPDRPPYRPRN